MHCINIKNGLSKRKNSKLKNLHFFIYFYLYRYYPINFSLNNFPDRNTRLDIVNDLLCKNDTGLRNYLLKSFF